MQEEMKNKSIRQKRIIFNVSEEDHMVIKRIATDQKMTMRTWIINAMAEAIKKINSNG